MLPSLLTAVLSRMVARISHRGVVFDSVPCFIMGHSAAATVVQPGTWG